MERPKAWRPICRHMAHILAIFPQFFMNAPHEAKRGRIPEDAQHKKSGHYSAALIRIDILALYQQCLGLLAPFYYGTDIARRFRRKLFIRIQKDNPVSLGL